MKAVHRETSRAILALLIVCAIVAIGSVLIK